MLQNESKILLLISGIIQKITITFNSLSQGFNLVFFELKSSYGVSFKIFGLPIKIYYKISHPNRFGFFTKIELEKRKSELIWNLAHNLRTVAGDWRCKATVLFLAPGNLFFVPKNSVFCCWKYVVSHSMSSHNLSHLFSSGIYFFF